MARGSLERWWCLLTAVCLGGCQQPVNYRTEPQRFPVEKLNLEKLLGPAAPADDGRVTIRPMNGWLPGMASQEFLASFQESLAKKLPIITVQALQNRYADTGITQVTADNVGEFVKAVGAKVNVEQQIEAVEPLILGDKVFARYVLKLERFDSLSDRRQFLESQVLETIVDGRLYVIDLRVQRGAKPPESLLKSRNSAYAIAAGLNFTKNPAGNEPEKPAAEPPAAEKPAAEKPVEPPTGK